MPLVTPPTTPVVDTVATPTLALQVPPGDGSVKVIVEPWHTADGPEIVPAVRKAPMDNVRLATAVPQLFVTVYRMVSSPGLMAVSVPIPVITANVLVTDHTPPVAALVYVVMLPAQIVDRPIILPALGVGTAVIVFVAHAEPQLAVTV